MNIIPHAMSGQSILASSCAETSILASSEPFLHPSERFRIGGGSLPARNRRVRSAMGTVRVLWFQQDVHAVQTCSAFRCRWLNQAAEWREEESRPVRFPFPATMRTHQRCPDAGGAFRDGGKAYGHERRPRSPASTRALCEHHQNLSGNSEGGGRDEKGA